MLTNGDPIPVHFPTEITASNAYTVPGELGYIFGYPTAAATWTLPDLTAIVMGAPLWVSNRSTSNTITLVPAAGDSVNGPVDVAPGYTASLVTDGTTVWKVTGVAANNGGAAPTTITVNPAATANGVTVFNTIQSAIDSLGNKQILNTTINVAAGTYAENLVLRSILASNLGTFVLNGDTRAVVGCGIAHGMYWNNTTTAVTPLGGGTASEAVLVGVTGGATISVTTLVPVVNTSVNPDFTAVGGAAIGDRLAVRHTDGSFAIYSITNVAATVLTVSPVLAANVNALGAAICILPNVNVAPAAGAPWTWETRATMNGFMTTIPAGVDAGLVIRGASRCNHSGCMWYAGAVSTRSNEAYTAVASTGSKGSSFFNCTTEVYRGGNSQVVLSNSLLAPALGANCVTAAERVQVMVPAARFIGNAPMLQVNDSSVTVDATSRPLEFYYTGTVAPITLANGASMLVNSGTAMRIRGSPLTGVQMSASKFLMETTSALTFVTTDVNGTVLDLAAAVTDSNPAGVSPAVPSVANVNFGAVTLPASATAWLAKVSDGSALTVNATAASTLGAASNGFLVQRASVLTWAAASTLTGGTGGIAFDVRSGSTMTCTGAAGVITAYGTIYRFDTGSRGYLTGMTSTTDAGAFTNLLVRNGSKVVLGTVTFNVSGANIGISQNNGGQVVREVAGAVTNNATVPVLLPTTTVGVDVAAATVAAGSTDNAGTVNCTTTAGGNAAGSFTLNFTTAFAVAPTVGVWFAAANPGTLLRVTSVSTTAAVFTMTTPAGAGTAFSVSYQTAIN